MPGIVGIIRRHKYDGITADLRRMIGSMMHETFYTSSQYINEQIGLYMGRVSHGENLGHQMPLESGDGQRALMITGEHFPQSNGHVDGHVMSQDLLRLYTQSETKLLRHLNGWFSGVAIDLCAGTATLFNDRYGMGRVYVHEGEEEFIFASEAKAILSIRPDLRKIDPAALGEYLRFNCVMGNKTLFRGISLLPVASSWRFKHGTTPHKGTYFEFTEWEQQEPDIPERFQERFNAAMARITPRYTEGPEKVGLSLTAGLDTRVILAAASADGKFMPSYTFGGLWGETYDIRAARMLAQRCNNSHEVIKIQEQFLRDFSKYARKSVYLSDGTHDSILGAHDVYFNEVARKIAPIRLTGKFGSEVVRIRKLIPAGSFPIHTLQSGFAPFLDTPCSFAEISQRAHPLTRVVAEEIPWFEFGRVKVEQSMVVLRTPYMDNELVQLMFGAPAAMRASRGLQTQYVMAASPKLAGIPTNMGGIREGGLAATLSYALFWALFKVEFIYLYATPHWLTRLDRKMEKLRLERIIAGRQKFEGYRIWIKTYFADFVRDVMLDPQAHCTEFFDKNWVRKIVTRHTAGTHNYFLEINKMLTVELIYSSLLQPEDDHNQPTAIRDLSITMVHDA